MTKDKIINAATLFEQGLKRKPEKVQLRLFITGATPRSCRAVFNLKNICEENLPGLYILEVIDVYQHPELAGEEQIIAAPTLIKHYPLPRQVMVGDLSDRKRVEKCLGISSAL